MESRLRTTFSHMSRSTYTGSPSGGQSTVNVEARPLDGRAEDAGQLGGGRGEVDRLEARLDPAGLEPREVEQGVDQLAQPQRVALDDLELLAQPRVAVERPASARSSATGPMISVSGVRNSWLTLEKKSVLARSSSAERLGPLPLGLVARRVGDRGRDLVGHQVDEAAVVVVERAVRVQPDDEHAGGLRRVPR